MCQKKSLPTKCLLTSDSLALFFLPCLRLRLFTLKGMLELPAGQIINNFFSDGNGFSFDQEDLVKFYALYSEMMDFWDKLFPNKIYDISL